MCRAAAAAQAKPGARSGRRGDGCIAGHSTAPPNAPHGLWTVFKCSDWQVWRRVEGAGWEGVFGARGGRLPPGQGGGGHRQRYIGLSGGARQKEDKQAAGPTSAAISALTADPLFCLTPPVVCEGKFIIASQSTDPRPLSLIQPE